jgi:CubicO group peptidase (beta-lactamase class C family)
MSPPLLFLVLFSICGACAQHTPDAPPSKADSLFAHLNKTTSPGLAVLVVRNGQVLLRKGYGMANLEHKIPITPATVFDIASVSKQFAGMAVAMLVEQGKISLDDDIRKYIPELPDFGHKITIDHLVHHTSGLRDWPGALSVAGWQMDDVISFEQILTMAYHQRDLNFTPGSEYAYSNTGYNVLVEMMQRVTGKSFREWTDTHLFKPLGMHNTHFQDDHQEVVAGKAYGYGRSDTGSFRTIHDGLTALGSSSLYTTIDDLAKWAVNLDNPKVGGPAVLARMLQTGVLNDGKKIKYAFGLEVDQHQGLKTIAHSGGWAGFNTHLVHFPDQHLSVVALSNSDAASAGRAAYDLADLYLGSQVKPAKAVDAAKKPTFRRVGVNTATLDAYVGTYRLGPAWYVTIARNGNQLTAYATEEEVVPLTAQSQSAFWVAAYGDSIVFNRNPAGRVIGFTYRSMSCPKMENFRLGDQQKLEEFTGTYASEEFGTEYTVAVEAGKLVMKHRRHGTLPLNAAWKDDFRGDEWFMQGVAFYRSGTGKVAGLTITQGRNRNMRFVKKQVGAAKP